MKNKVLVELLVPEVDESYSIYLPINKRIGNVIELLNKAVSELTDNIYKIKKNNFIYNVNTNERYDINKTIMETDIRNGTKIVLI